MGVISRAFNSLSKCRQQILITLCIGIFGTATSVAIAIPLDKVQYNVIISEDNYPLLIAKKNKYGFSEKLSQTELNTLDVCNSSTSCSNEAVQKGANKYFMSSAGGYGLATAYYNSDGKLVGTHLGGISANTDNTSPVITLSGANPLSLLKGTAYSEPGATAQDETDGTVTVSISGYVNENTVGTYIIMYTAVDAAGNQATRTRTVQVTEAADTTPPVITITGANPVSVTVGTSYNDAGASALDDRDGTISTTFSGTVNTNSVGTYYIQYNATDSAGNSATTKTRTVYVVGQNSTDNTPPVISINGSSTITIQKGNSYNDAGATAVDDVDGSVSVSTSGSVNTNIVGTYSKTYTASDLAGNISTAIRTVHVVDNTPPTIPTAPSLPVVDGNSFNDSTLNPVGYLDGEFAVSPSGAATYNVPIAIPPGTAGVQPDISLSYNSQSGIGIAGKGWSLSGLSSISRCPKTKAQDGIKGGVEMNATDVYCLDGQKLIKIYENLNVTEGDPLRRFKTETDDYSEIKLIKKTGGNYFRVETKSGEIHTYGSTDDSSIYLDYLPGVAPDTRRLSFLLNQTKDLLGNYIKYTYQNVGNFKGKIKRIDYTGNLNTGLVPYNFIDFTYENSTQPYTGYILGSNRYVLTRLKKIRVRYNASTIRDYDLSYLDVSSDITKVDKLKSIQECVGSQCLPATVFKWDGYYQSTLNVANAPFSDTKNLPRSFEPVLSAYIPTDKGSKSFSTRTSASNAFDTGNIQKLIGDVDGDGLTDIVSVIRPSSSQCSGSTVCLQVESSDGFNFHSPQVTTGLAESNGNASTSPFFMADVDGDSLADLVNFSPNGNVVVYLSNGTKFSSGVIWQHENNVFYNFGFISNLKRNPILIQDINDDGKADIINFGGNGVYVSYSNGYGFAYPTRVSSYFGAVTSNLDTGLYRQNYSNDNVSVELIDVSADGLPDIVVHNASGTMVALNKMSSQIGNIVSFDPQLDSQSGEPIVAGNPSFNTPTNGNTPRIMGDVNSDGYPDIVGFFENGIHVAYGIGKNNSNKLFLPYQFKVNDWTTNYGWDYTEKPIYVADVNSDGRSDIVALDDNGIFVRLAGTNGFDSPISWNSNSYTSNSNWDKNNSVRSLGDFNGDGLPDFIGIKGSLIRLGINQAKQHRISQFIIGGEVSNISFAGMNRSIDVEYEKLTAPLEKSVYTKSADSRAVQAPMFVVSAHFSSNGNSFNAAGSRNRKIGMLYQYEGLAFDITNGRGSLGFKKRITKDLSKNIYSVATFHQDYPLTGKLKNIENFLMTGNTSKRLSKKTIKTESRSYASLNNKRYYKVYVENEDETIYDLISSVAYQRNVSTFGEPSTCGNIANTKVTNYGLTSNIENYSKETTAIYSPGSDCFQQSRLTSTSVASLRNGSGLKIRNSKFTYYSNGQIHTEVIEPQNTKKLTTTYTYDSFGNVLTTSVSGSDIATRTSTTAYDSKGRFTTRTINALNQITTKVYDQKLGVVTSVTGINNLTTKMYYNTFAQKYLTVKPNNSYVHTTYNWNAEAIGNSNARYHTQTNNSEGGSVRKLYDQLDRLIRTTERGLDGQISIIDKQYDLETGELEKETLPYLTNASQQWISYTYDDLGRTKSIVKPGQNAAQINYNGLQRTATDQQSKTKTHTDNVLGKPYKVLDDLGNEIRYQYYSDGSLKKTINNAFSGNSQDSPSSSSLTTSFEYDIFGNKIKMIDPDMGTWTYTYYSTGELKTQRDSKGQLQTLYYDKLGRLFNRVEASGTTNWLYDTALGKGKGKLASVSTSGSQKYLSYDNLGQLALEEVRIANAIDSQNTTTYFTQKLYDEHGRIDTVKYPNMSASNSASIEVKYEYSNGGKLKRIKNARSGGQYWEANESNAFGNITEQTFGNGVKRTESYDNLGRIDKILSSKSNNSVIQFLDYDFDQVGNLVKRQNSLAQASETFAYDGIDRLKTINTTYQSATGSELIRYDGHGNITKKKDKTYSYFDNSKHAVSNVGSDSYTYDANGNMDAGAGRTISWNSFNKPSNISRGTKSIQLLYDADRSRVYKETKDTSTNGINKKTWYVNGIFEREQLTSGSNSGAETHKYYLKTGSQTIGYITQHISNTGTREATNTRYLLNDHLGSIDIITNDVGNVVQKLDFDSWGNRRGSDWTANPQLASILVGINAQAMKMGFTGHEHDDEVGLINMKGRLYDPEIGRFISADTYVQSPTDTQSYNRYTYVKNNPLSYTDPSGHYFWFIAAAAVAITAVAAPEYLRTVIAIIAVIYTGGAASAYFGAYGATASAIAGGAVGGFVGGAISTGTLSGALRGAAFGALSAGLTSGIAQNIGDGIGRAVAHGVAQGTVSVLRGGKFGAGFVSGFASHVAAPSLRGANKYVNTAKAAVLGGTVSRLVGGKFANGAITGAFVHLFNAELTKAEANKKLLGIKNKMLAMKSLPQNVKDVVKKNSFYYTEGTESTSKDLITFADGTTAGLPVRGENFSNDTIRITSLAFTSDARLINTMFHEIQHDISVNFSHSSDLNVKHETPFNSAYQKNVDLYNKEY